MATFFVPPSHLIWTVFREGSLYVSNLDAAAHEKQLEDIFGHFGQISSIRLCGSRIGQFSPAHGYINFRNPDDAVRALNLHRTFVNGKPINVMLQYRNTRNLRNGYANVFVKNLHPSVQSIDLYNGFKSYGTVLTCKVATDSNGQSKSYGFVQFHTGEEAQSAISELNGTIFHDRQIYVARFIPRALRYQLSGPPNLKSVYIKNLSDSFTERDLINVFKECGPISSAVVMKDEMGRSKCFGFINFVYAQHAFNATEKFHGHQYNDKIWYVRRAQSKLERAAELKANYEQMRNRRFQEQWGLNLYLKNLDATFDTDGKLRELFSPFGTITSAKVVVDAKGQTKGYGYVAFSTRDEANRALNEMNGMIIGGRPLYVAIFEPKAQRIARLQGHFARFIVPQVVAPAFPYTTGYTTTHLVNQNYMITDHMQWHRQYGQQPFQPYEPSAYPQGPMLPSLYHLSWMRPTGSMPSSSHQH